MIIGQHKDIKMEGTDDDMLRPCGHYLLFML